MTRTIIPVEGEPSRCLGCGGLQRAHEPHDGKVAVPRPGDISICGNCLTPGIYEERCRVRAPATDEERQRCADALSEVISGGAPS